MTQDIAAKKDEVLELLCYKVDDMADKLDNLEPGSTEYSRLASDMSKLMDVVCTQYNRENDADLKYEEIKQKVFTENVKTAIAGVTAATGIAGIWMYRKSLAEILHFEQTGSIITSAGKGLVGTLTRLMPFR